MTMNPAGAKKSQKIVLELAGVNYTRPAFSDLLEVASLPALLGPGVKSAGAYSSRIVLPL
jgi:hypothetical protein